jgi:acetylornithine deacetylase/succinyl-diaminopimelate desuccinylase-like protein
LTVAAGASTDLWQRPAELLQRLIRFDTTNPPGNERECIAFIEGLLSDAGIESNRFARDPDRPNLVARLPGRGAAAPLLLYGHVDVVSTAGQSWSHDPFGGEEREGYVWGRGAVDMKGGVAMMISALLRAKAEGLEPAGDVIFCALADEEAMGRYGAEWLVREHPELFADVRYALGEFGGFTTHLAGRRFYPIQVAEKQVCTLAATIRGPGGHGSIPQRGGTTARLARMLSRLDREGLPIHVTPVVHQMLTAVASHLPRPQALLVRQLERPAFARAALPRMGDRARVLSAVLRNTASPTIIETSKKFNVIPSEIEVTLDGRILPGYEPDDLLRELRALIGDDIELEVKLFDPSPADPDLSMLGMLGEILERADPGAAAVPLLMAGVTDGRFFSRLGIQTYGFTPLKLPAGFDFWSGVHGSDERVPVEAIAFGADAMHTALARFGQTAGGHD